MNRFHLEVLRIKKDGILHSCVCRVYRFTDEKLRQVLNEEVNQFDTGSKVLVNIGTKGVDVLLRKENEGTNNEKTFAYISNWVGIVVPICLESCRITSFDKNDGTFDKNNSTSQKSSVLLQGKMTDFIEKCINIENRKFRDNL